MMPESPQVGTFGEVALLLGFTALVGAIALRLRQPALIAYIVVGIVAGPSVLGLVQAHDAIGLLAQMGVAVLLFVVGLRLDLTHVRHIGPVALATGLGQLAFTILFGLLLTLLMGKGYVEALYIAVALTFSSTIIIVKLLSDKRELDTLHGRIAVGFLIVQDIAVVVAMMTMSGLQGAGETGGLAFTASLLLRIVAAGLLLYLLMRFVLPRLTALIARSQELLLVFAIAWGTGLAALGDWAGFSKEAGAFLAGFSLASTAYREAMSARLTGVRDFLLLFFFIDLGTKLDLSTLGGELVPAVVLSLFVLIGNPLIVMAIMGYMGYRKRTGFMAGLTVAQISEFSIVFVAMGITLGHVDIGALGLTTLVGMVTILLSTYMILYSRTLYEWLGPWLGLFERDDPYREMAMESQGGLSSQPQVIIFGLGRYGGRLLARLSDLGLQPLGVDFDPEVIGRLKTQGVAVRFGDGEDPDFLESLPLQRSSWVITTFPYWQSNRALLHALKQVGYTGHIVAMVRDERHGHLMRQAGVHRIMNVVHDATDHVADVLVTEIRQGEQET